MRGGRSIRSGRSSCTPRCRRWGAWRSSAARCWLRSSICTCSPARRSLPQAEKARIYADVYLLALVIPVISVLGVVIAEVLKARERSRLVTRGMSRDEARRTLEVQDAPARTELVDTRRKPRLRGLHADHGARRYSVQPGDHFRRLVRDRGVPRRAPHARARSGLARNADRHGDRDLRVSRDARAGARRELVDR